MLVSEIIQSSIPVLRYEDSVEEAIDLLQQYNTAHLPVIHNDNYEGLLSMDELLAAEDADILSMLTEKFIHVSIPYNQHFLSALKLMAVSGVTAMPVLSQNKEYLGVVTESILIQTLNNFLGNEVPGGIFVVEMPKQNFSMGEICRLVETNDAFVTQFNTYTEHLSGALIVTFKINKTEVSDILATLQRYEYNVRYYFGEEQYENALKENFDNLMAYLNV